MSVLGEGAEALYATGELVFALSGRIPHVLAGDLAWSQLREMRMARVAATERNGAAETLEVRGEEGLAVR